MKSAETDGKKHRNLVFEKNRLSVKLIANMYYVFTR